MITSALRLAGAGLVLAAGAGAGAACPPAAGPTTSLSASLPTPDSLLVTWEQAGEGAVGVTLIAPSGRPEPGYRMNPVPLGPGQVEPAVIPDQVFTPLAGAGTALQATVPLARALVPGTYRACLALYASPRHVIAAREVALTVAPPPSFTLGSPQAPPAPAPASAADATALDPTPAAQPVALPVSVAPPATLPVPVLVHPVSLVRPAHRAPAVSASRRRPSARCSVRARRRPLRVTSALRRHKGCGIHPRRR